MRAIGRLRPPISCALVLLVAAGCLSSGRVAVRTVRTDTLFQKMRVNVLNSREMSPQTAQVLRLYTLDQRFAVAPVEVLGALDQKVKLDPDPDTVFAIAELSYLTARRMEPMKKQAALAHYAGSLVHAYFYLFDEKVAREANPYDPRFRLACDLYNRSLAKCIELGQRRANHLQDGLHLDFGSGTLDIAVQPKDLPWPTQEFEQFLFADQFEVNGLENHYHGFGLGVPLIGVRTTSTAAPKGTYEPPRQSIPVTAFLRMNCRLTGKDAASRSATLELYDPLRVDEIDVAGRKVPLESDLTTPLGYFLSHARLEKLALVGLFRADKLQKKAGLFMVEPYQKGKIPVVMIHGIWSSPMTWMQMFNDLRGDPEIRERFQFWFFLYPTGNPILYSAATLRQSLAETLASVDPKGEDAALGKMVLVGHSMGGLLAKTMAQSSQNELWDAISNRPLDRIQAEPAERSLIERTFFFEPQPFVQRVVFIATPHRGSELSDRRFARLVARMISLPSVILDARARLLAENPGTFNQAFTSPPTSVANLAPESPVLQVTARIPIRSGVRVHSIVGNIKSGPPENGTDGVVPYWSSHWDGAESERIVHSGHNAHMHPDAVQEVRRILLEHLAAAAPTPEVQHAN